MTARPGPGRPTLAGVCQAERYLQARGKELVTAKRADLEAFIGDLLGRRAAVTTWTYHKALRVLYAWLVEEQEIDASPMARMRPPIVPEQPVPVVPDDGLRRLLKACDGRDFEARRDTAIILLLLDIGPRRGELAGVKLADVDLDLVVVTVLGKGRRPRSLPFGHRAGVPLDRYLRARARHRLARLDWLWLGPKGRLTDSGMAQMLRRRGAEAGLPGLYPHRLRHTFAHQWLAEGMLLIVQAHCPCAEDHDQANTQCQADDALHRVSSHSMTVRTEWPVPW